MKGIHLSSLTGELHKVHPRYNKKPANAITGVQERLSNWATYAPNRYYEFEDYTTNYHELPLEAFKDFSFDELCKLRLSSKFAMHESVDKLFESDPNFECFRKIQNSMWRWGVRSGLWNDAVEAYNRIRHFNFGVSPDFEISLDHSTGYNPFGRSKYARVFLDGTFGFLLHYKGEHVLTIGFSITAGRKVLVQQVQLVKRRRNKFLYKLPNNYIEFVLGLFTNNFPKHKIFLVQGESLVQKILRDYYKGLDDTRRCIGAYREYLPLCKTKTEQDFYLRSIEEWEVVCVETKERIEHLENDARRIADLYRGSGQFLLGCPLKINGLVHHQVLEKDASAPLTA